MAGTRSHTYYIIKLSTLQEEQAPGHRVREGARGLARFTAAAAAGMAAAVEMAAAEEMARTVAMAATVEGTGRAEGATTPARQTHAPSRHYGLATFREGSGSPRKLARSCKIRDY